MSAAISRFRAFAESLCAALGQELMHTECYCQDPFDTHYRYKGMIVGIKQADHQVSSNRQTSWDSQGLPGNFDMRILME
jgi:hypothetical protein